MTTTPKFSGLVRLPRKFAAPIRVRGIVNDHSGYGLHLQYTVKYLARLGYRVETVPMSDVEKPFPEVIASLKTEITDKQRELVILPASHKVGSHQWVFTMYETTRLPKRMVKSISGAHTLIVPSKWVAQNFNAQGIEAPIHVVPLGFNPKIFYPSPFISETFVFGTAGNPSMSVAARKNIDMVLEAFSLAFPKEKDVKLRVKVLPTCIVTSNGDPRIEIVREIFTEEEMGGWMRGLNAFVSASKGEAFGFFNVQAMASGVPVICANFGGVQDYFSDTAGYSVDYELAEARNSHYDTGLWAEPSLPSMIEQMRRAYANRDEAAQKGATAHQRVAGLSWRECINKLNAVLRKTHFWEKYETVHTDSDEDRILRFYRCAIQNIKGPLPDLHEKALSNTPRGLGDTLLFSHLPYVGACQGKPRFIHANPEEHRHFSTLMKYNPYYMPKPDSYGVAFADVLQKEADMGNGHFIQRLQRAFGLEPVLRPQPFIHLPLPKVNRRVMLHFEAGGPHSGWQRVFLHPRARQLYPESKAIIQEFIDNHPELEFFQIGKEQLDFRKVRNVADSTLEDTIKLMAGCELFIGIISGPMHIASALGLRSIVVINFPPASHVLLPTLVDIDQVESEWFYPQNVHLHQESEGPQVKQLSYRTLEDAYQGKVYPYWSDRFLPLIHERL
jgi:glycosyltransferase involved in cell wall biosynthesis